MESPGRMRTFNTAWAVVGTSFALFPEWNMVGTIVVLIAAADKGYIVC